MSCLFVVFTGINPKNSARKESLGSDWLSKSPADLGKPRNTQLASLGRASVVYVAFCFMLAHQHHEDSCLVT